MDRRGVPARALAPRAENFAARAQAQDARGGMRRFAAKFREHGVKHRAGHFVLVFGIVQREVQNVAGPLDHHSGEQCTPVDSTGLDDMPTRYTRNVSHVNRGGSAYCAGFRLRRHSGTIARNAGSFKSWHRFNKTFYRPQ